VKKLSYSLILASLSLATITNAATLSCFNPEKKAYTYKFKTSEHLEYNKKLKAYKVSNITDAINTCKYNAGDNYIPVVNSLTSHYKLIGTYDLSHEIDNNVSQKKINNYINSRGSNEPKATLRDFKREGFSMNGYELIKRGNNISKLAVVTLDDLLEIEIPEGLNEDEELEIMKGEFLHAITQMPAIIDDKQARLLASVMLSYAHQGGFIFPTVIPTGKIDTDNKDEEIYINSPIAKHTDYIAKYDNNKLSLNVNSIATYQAIDLHNHETPLLTQNIKIKSRYEVSGTAEKHTITGKSISIKMLDYDPENSLQKLLALSLINKMNNSGE